MIKRAIQSLKAWAKRVKSEIYALYIAMHDQRTPAYAKYFAMLVIGYALSPIDLIPDFIPVLGLLDDLILLPLGIVALEKMIPLEVMAHARRQAHKLVRSGLPASQTAAMIVVGIWALVLSSSIWWAVNRLMFDDPDVRRATSTPANIIEPHERSDRQNTSPARDADRDRSRDR